MLMYSMRNGQPICDTLFVEIFWAYYDLWHNFIIVFLQSWTTRQKKNNKFAIIYKNSLISCHYHYYYFFFGKMSKAICNVRKIYSFSLTLSLDGHPAFWLTWVFITIIIMIHLSIFIQKISKRSEAKWKLIDRSIKNVKKH